MVMEEATTIQTGTSDFHCAEQNPPCANTQNRQIMKDHHPASKYVPKKRVISLFCETRSIHVVE